MNKHTTTGIIVLNDDYNKLYKIGDISYTVWEDDSFEYVIKPFYPVIDLLKPPVFQGIPGLNLDLRKNEYIRKNIVPVFISERVPSKSREDLVELLDSVGLDHYNPLEWLIRTDTQYFGDRLYVISNDKYTLYAEQINLLNTQDKALAGIKTID